MSDIGYIRVSTIDQNEARQLEALKKYNINKLFIEKQSAKDTDRPEYQKMIEYIREGDTLYILDFSRISRGTADLLKIVEELQARKIKLVSIKENLDTSTPTGKLMLTMIGAINEFERTNLLERQREGIEIAKKEGKYKGRKPVEKPKNWDEIFSLYLQKELPATEAMKKLDLKKDIFYKFAKEHYKSLPIGLRPRIANEKFFKANYARAF